jgi:hypothetical protein
VAVAEFRRQLPGSVEVRRAGLVAQDVRVIQPGGEADLALEAFRPQGRHQLGVEKLERHWAIAPEVAREIHGGHATAPELALEEVAVAQCVGER